MSRQTYKEYKEQLKAEQGDMTKEEIIELMSKKSEFMADLDNLKPQEHRWVDRGLVMSCEHAGHPNHRSFKVVR